MKPLKAQLGELDGHEGELAELFAAAPIYRKNLLRKRRIKAMVVSGTRERRRPLGMALAAALLIAGTATAATLGHRLLTADERVAHVPAPPEVRVATPTEGASTQHLPTPISEPAPPQPEPEATKDTPAPVAKPTPKPRRVAQAGKVAQVSTHKLAAGEDPTRVVQAIRALRQQGDAAKAQVLLNDYMKQNPNGLLSEEALALSIEAAHDRRDPRAKSYARRYLSRFPNGRHRAFASRVLAE